MAAIDLKTLTPDTTVPTGAVLFGADDQTAATPSVYSLADIMKSVGETSATAAIAGGVLNIDCTKDLLAVSLNANITSITFSNIPAAPAVKGVVLEFTCDGTARTITWPASVKWPGGTAPTLTSDAGKKDVFVLVTSNGGTSWLAFTGGQKL